MKTTIVFLAILLASKTVFTQIPRTLSYQGVLTDNTGNPKPNGMYYFVFSLYDVATGGLAIYTQQESLAVNRGLFSTILGAPTTFGPDVVFDRQYWLGIQEGDSPELAPRVALTGTAYSMTAIRADTANIALMSSGPGSWGGNDSAVYRLNGNVGIGASTPNNRLEIGINNGLSNSEGLTIFNRHSNGYGGSLNFGITTTSGGSFLAGQITAENQDNQAPDGGKIHLRTASHDASHTMNTAITIDAYTRVGIGTTAPTAQLEIQGGDRWTTAQWYKGLKLNNAHAVQFDAGTGLKFGIGASASGSSLYFFTSTSDGTSEDPSYKMRLDESGRLHVGNTHIYDNEINRDNDDNLYIGYRNTANTILQVTTGNVGIGTSSPSAKLEVVGRTKTSVLVITGLGGSDLAEPFEISSPDDLPAGSVTIIDDERAGALKLSEKAYDSRVAGVLSGAGGLKAGVTLGHSGFSGRGQNLVLSGRAYVRATASNGTIEPGDLLTTSDVAGHAMKATGSAIPRGSVIGKAMSTLSDDGLVLVLIQPQ